MIRNLISASVRSGPPEYRELWCSVISQAYDDLGASVSKVEPEKGMALRESAYDYFFNPRSTFPIHCFIVGLNPETFRRGLSEHPENIGRRFSLRVTEEEEEEEI
jgi:hypothetical protein